jgi:hypothetical protein
MKMATRPFSDPSDSPQDWKAEMQWPEWGCAKDQPSLRVWCDFKPVPSPCDLGFLTSAWMLSHLL